MTTPNPRMMVFANVLDALKSKFGEYAEPDVDELNNSYLIYIGNVTIELTFNEDKESQNQS